MALLTWTIPLLLVVVFALATLASGWRTGWFRIARMFGEPPQPSVSLAKWAYCIIGPMRLPLHIGKSEAGLVISPPFPLSLILPRIWAPWSEISRGGPSWFWREDLDVRGFTIAVPPLVAQHVREAQSVRVLKPMKDDL